MSYSNTIENKLIVENRENFKILHQKKNHKVSKLEKNIDIIIIPTTINVCINTIKHKIDFIKYAKYMISILNDGFSGNLSSPYKNIDNKKNFKYNIDYIKNILEKQKDSSNEMNVQMNAEIIYKYINTKNDTKIRFYLHSIVYHDVFIEEIFENNNTEKFMEKINKSGFKILHSHEKFLNINIIKFKCSTLGVSVFPWMKYISQKNCDYMQVFLDYCTIHPDIANNKYNNCRTLIHEVGHIFGLRHSFSGDLESLKAYSILLGKIGQTEILNKINLTNKIELTKIKSSKKSSSNSLIIETDLTYFKDKIFDKNIDVQLYPDIPLQMKSTDYNPFEKKKFPFYNNIPSNFACFMDYSPDVVLTHFTESQIKIMHYMIILFKPYLIKKTELEMNNLNNNKVKLYINKKTNTVKTFLNIILNDTSPHKYYVLYDDKNYFKYIILNPNDNLKYIYKSKNKK